MPIPELKVDAETANDLELMKDSEKEVQEEDLAPEPELETPEKQEPEKTVKLAALHESRAETRAERQKREDAERRLVDLEKRADERFNKIMGLMQPKEQPPAVDSIPDPETDALGALKMTTKQIHEFTKFKENFERQQQQAEGVQRLTAMAVQAESEFLSSNPDYREASVFLQQSRSDELAALGMYTPDQIQQVIRNEALQVASEAFKNGKNPAEVIYALAKARKFTPAAKQETSIERVAAGQEASKSLGQAGGAAIASGAKMDGKTLANMSDEQFEKYYNAMSKADRRRYMGE